MFSQEALDQDQALARAGAGTCTPSSLGHRRTPTLVATQSPRRRLEATRSRKRSTLVNDDAHARVQVDQLLPSLMLSLVESGCAALLRGSSISRSLPSSPEDDSSCRITTAVVTSGPTTVVHVVQLLTALVTISRRAIVQPTR